MKIEEINPDVKLAVVANDGYCPCALEKTDDTKCMCKEFREAPLYSTCHCGRFMKTEE